MTEQPPFRPEMTYLSFEDADLKGTSDDPPIITIRFLTHHVDSTKSVLTMGVPWPFQGMEPEAIRQLMSVAIAMPSGHEQAVFVDGRVADMLQDHIMTLQTDIVLDGLTEMLKDNS